MNLSFPVKLYKYTLHNIKMNLKNILLGIAIIILTIFVTFYGINTIFPKPQYEDFCPSSSYYGKQIPFEDRALCPQVCTPMYEIVRGECVYNECGSGCGPDNVNSFSTQAQCQQGIYDIQCYERYDAASKERARKVFFVALPLGVLIIALGAFGFGLEAVGAGLMGGGIGTLIYGSGAYWPYTENWVRFLLSLIGLIILIWLAYYFNKKIGKKSKKKR